MCHNSLGNWQIASWKCLDFWYHGINLTIYVPETEDVHLLEPLLIEPQGSHAFEW